MKIGLFGGTFDPIHIGHLILAERSRDEAALDAVWLLPSFRPPHKPDRKVSSFEDRCEMLSASLAGLSAYRVETIEADLPSPSYTAETLAALRARDPSTDFHLILGADSLIDLPYWYEPQRVLAQAGLIVVPRPGVELWTAERLASSLHLPSSAVRMQTVPCPLMDVASRDLRRRVADGRSIRFMVPREVETIIRQRGLYV